MVIISDIQVAYYGKCGYPVSSTVPPKTIDTQDGGEIPETT